MDVVSIMMSDGQADRPSDHGDRLIGVDHDTADRSISRSRRCRAATWGCMHITKTDRQTDRGTGSYRDKTISDGDICGVIVRTVSLRVDGLCLNVHCGRNIVNW